MEEDVKDLLLLLVVVARENRRDDFFVEFCLMSRNRRLFRVLLDLALAGFSVVWAVARFPIDLLWLNRDLDLFDLCCCLLVAVGRLVRLDAVFSLLFLERRRMSLSSDRITFRLFVADCLPDFSDFPTSSSSSSSFGLDVVVVVSIVLVRISFAGAEQADVSWVKLVAIKLRLFISLVIIFSEFEMIDNDESDDDDELEVDDRDDEMLLLLLLRDNDIITTTKYYILEIRFIFVSFQFSLGEGYL